MFLAPGNIPFMNTNDDGTLKPHSTPDNSLKKIPKYSGVMCVEVLYENIDQVLPNKLHGPMHNEIRVAWVYTGHMIYTPL